MFLRERFTWYKIGESCLMRTGYLNGISLIFFYYWGKAVKGRLWTLADFNETWQACRVFSLDCNGISFWRQIINYFLDKWDQSLSIDWDTVNCDIFVVITRAIHTERYKIGESCLICIDYLNRISLIFSYYWQGKATNCPSTISMKLGMQSILPWI